MNSSKKHPMLPASAVDIIAFPASERPRLVVIIDAEEEFDWDAPFSRSNRSVKTVKAQFRAQRIFEKYRIIPTYAVDYPVASQPEGYLPLKELLDSDACNIGAQLHPWVTPPHEEEVCERNSYAGNLAPDLEYRKLVKLTDMIGQSFGTRPKLYRAGRYGAGTNTVASLEQLGYEIDCSVLPGQSAGALGPDYNGGTPRPYWLGRNKSILEIPVTVATVGLAGRFGDTLYRQLASPMGRAMKIPAILARTGLMDRIRLTPEGTTLEEAKRLTRRMCRAGHRVFAISYHTPSLVPGNTQYVRNEKELQVFLDWLEGYFDFFFDEMRGEATTPIAIRNWALCLKNQGSHVQFENIMGRKVTPRRTSVVIPAHNSSATLARAIDSALSQTVRPYETIVVDDCSTDNTIEIAQSYADRGVRVVALKERSGAAGARNAGIEAAQGEFIAFLDSDDEWLPRKLERQLALMETDDRLSLVSCASTLIMPDGRNAGDVYGGHQPTVGPNAWKALLVANFIATPSVLARRKQLLSLGGFDRRLKIGEDQDMWIRLALIGNIGFVRENLVLVHERENSLSNWDLEEQLRYTLPMIERHVQVLSHRLTDADIRAIRGERIGRLGRVAYARGARLKGAKMVLEAMLLGYRPLENLYYLLNASPPATFVKYWLRQGLAR